MRDGKKKEKKLTGSARRYFAFAAVPRYEVGCHASETATSMAEVSENRWPKRRQSNRKTIKKAVKKRPLGAVGPNGLLTFAQFDILPGPRADS